MPLATIANVRLAGIAAAVPTLRTMSWEELGVPADRFKRSRAFHRRLVVRAAQWEQCQSDLCHRAAETLLKDLAWSPAEIDVVVMITITPDYPIPATAIILQDRLGIPKTALAFDLPGGEASFFHGLQLVASMLSAGHLRRGLLLVGEVSKIVEGPDAVESPDHVCGHNGGVFALEHLPGAAPLVFHSAGDGAQREAFYMKVGGTRFPPTAEMFSRERRHAFESPAALYTHDVAVCDAVAVRELPISMRAVLAAAGKSVADLDFCFVQPMGLDGEHALRVELGMRADRFHGRTREYGSGSSGGIVLAMLARAASQLSNGPRTSLLTGLGAGLAWGSALIETNRLVCPDILEI